MEMRWRCCPPLRADERMRSAECGMGNAELNEMSYLTRSPISLDALLAEVSSPACGGTCVFLGTVRNGPDEHGVTAIEYSAYEEMVEAEFGRLLADARGRWPEARTAATCAAATACRKMSTCGCRGPRSSHSRRSRDSRVRSRSSACIKCGSRVASRCCATTSRLSSR